MTPADVSEADLDAVGELLHAAIGLRTQNNLRGRLRRCIRDEAAFCDQRAVDYVAALTGGSGDLQRLVNRVTVQESGFFRHPNHFTVLADEILPAIAGPVTIWSSACANGQEAYSLAMLLEEQGVPGTVMATDLSTAALARTDAALYTSREVTGISAARRARHLTQNGRDWRINPAVRGRVRLQRHNLTSGLPDFVGSCQVVFCRNVLIYLSTAKSTLFLTRLADALPPGASLFLGSAESLWQVTERFQAVSMQESFLYRRRIAAVAPAKATGPAARRPATRSASRTASTSAPTRKPARRALSAPPSAAPPDPEELAATGRAALAAGDTTSAVVVFRKWAYLSPDDPLASFHLGLALEAGGHQAAALRAFEVSRETFLHAAGEGRGIGLEGFADGELLKLIDVKVRRSA